MSLSAHSHQAIAEPTIDRINERSAMKITIVLGAFVHAAALAAVELDPKIGDLGPFLLGFVAGGIGHLSHMSIFHPNEKTPLKMQIFVGGFLSGVVGPLTVQSIESWLPHAVNPRYALVAISFIAGLGGVQFIKVYGPGILERFGAVSFKKIEDLAGTPPMATPPNDDSTKQKVNLMWKKMTDSGDVPKG